MLRGAGYIVLAHYRGETIDKTKGEDWSEAPGEARGENRSENKAENKT